MTRNYMYICTAVVTEEDSSIIREHLRRMYEWDKDWQMLFNVDKCSVMHMRKATRSSNTT